jgi:hypothetical protein
MGHRRDPGLNPGSGPVPPRGVCVLTARRTSRFRPQLIARTPGCSARGAVLQCAGRRDREHATKAGHPWTRAGARGCASGSRGGRIRRGAFFHRQGSPQRRQVERLSSRSSRGEEVGQIRPRKAGLGRTARSRPHPRRRFGRRPWFRTRTSWRRPPPAALPDGGPVHVQPRRPGSHPPMATGEVHRSMPVASAKLRSGRGQVVAYRPR